MDDLAKLTSKADILRYQMNRHLAMAEKHRKTARELYSRLVEIQGGRNAPASHKALISENRFFNVLAKLRRLF